MFPILCWKVVCDHIENDNTFKKIKDFTGYEAFIGYRNL